MAIYDTFKSWVVDRFADASLTHEKAKSGEPNFGLSLLDYNPDDLVTSKGIGIQVYQKMLREPYVKAALELKKMEVLSWDWQIEAGSEEESDIEIADELTQDLHHLQGQTFREVMYCMLDALDAGYSIQEKIMKIGDDGSYHYKRIKSLNPYYWKFGTDEFGNVTDIVQDSVVGQQAESFPAEYFVVYSYRNRYNNPYGNSDLRAAYRAFFIKDTIYKFRNMYLERFGMPALVGKVRPGTNETEKDEMLAVLKQMQANANIVLPNDMEITILELATKTGSEFQDTIDNLNKDILVGILGSFMSVEEGAKTGARALGEVHQDSVKKAAQYVANNLSDVINEQIVRPWLLLNYGELENPPKFAFNTVADFDRVSEADVIDKLVSAGAPVTIREVMRKFGYTMPEEDDEPILKKAVAPSPFGGGEDDEEDDTDKADDEKLIQLREKFWGRLEPLYLEVASKTFKEIQKSKVLDNSDILKAQDMSLGVNVGNIKNALADALFHGNIIGRGGVVKFNKTTDEMLLDAGVTSEQFSEDVRKYDAEAHRLAGIAKDKFESAFRSIILSAVANGDSEKDVWSALYNSVQRAGIQDYTDEAVDVQAFSLGYEDGLRVRFADRVAIDEC